MSMLHVEIFPNECNFRKNGFESITNRAGQLELILLGMRVVIKDMFRTHMNLVRGHLVKNSRLTRLSKLPFFRGRFKHENSLQSKK